MPIVDLMQCIPAADDGTRTLLPKQLNFLQASLDQQGPKYIMYAGGVGSGKTVIGCLTIIAMAVQHSGDYLIARQFSPEMQITTRKCFLEMCPKEIIKEYRVADGIVRIRAADGGISNVIFRPAEEPDKWRSMNLNAAYIDEASQTSDECFTLLQTRLRGKAYRKILLTTNPAGHNFLWKRFIQQGDMKPEAKRQYLCLTAPSTENRFLPEGYVESMLNSFSEERAKREIFGSWDSFAGQVYAEFERGLHVVKPFVIPEDWTRISGLDHGYRNATCMLWGAVDPDDNVYVYREFYQKEWLIEEICRGRKDTGAAGIIALNKREKLEGVWADPSIKQTRGQTGISDWQVYLENLPRTWGLIPASNDVALGIDRVKSYLKLSPRTKKPRLFIFDTCTNLLEELTQYRWKERAMGQTETANEKEEPVKVNDHSCDALRYMLMSRPEGPAAKKPDAKRDSSWHMQQELKAIRNPSPKDPFGADF